MQLVQAPAVGAVQHNCVINSGVYDSTKRLLRIQEKEAAATRVLKTPLDELAAAVVDLRVNKREGRHDDQGIVKELDYCRSVVEGEQSQKWTFPAAAVEHTGTFSNSSVTVCDVRASDIKSFKVMTIAEVADMAGGVFSFANVCASPGSCLGGMRAL